VVSFESKYLKCIVTTQIRPELYAFYLYKKSKKYQIKWLRRGNSALLAYNAESKIDESQLVD